MNRLTARTIFIGLSSTVAASALLVACSGSGNTSSSSSGGGEEDAGTGVTDSGTGKPDSGTTKDAAASIDSTITVQVSGIFEPPALDGGVPDAGGLAISPLVLQNNGKDDLTIAKNGSFPFATKVNAYAVTVKTQPTGHTCVVTAGTGTATSAATTVQVACTRNEFVVTANVKGVKGTGLVLQNNGKDDLAIAAVGAKPFTTKVKFGDTYAVSVKTAPTHPTQACALGAGATGLMTGDATVDVDCTDDVFPSASYAETKTFTQAAGQLEAFTVSLAFDGTKYWVAAGDGGTGTLTNTKTIASYSAAGVFDTSYMPAGNPLSLFSVGGKASTIYAFGSNAATKILLKDNAGGFTDFVTLASPGAQITWPVLSGDGKEILTLMGDGTVKRWKQADGSDLAPVVLNGYGNENGETEWYTFHVLFASGYYLTLADGGKLTAWDPATGNRVKSTQLGGWLPAWSFGASISVSYANGMVWVFDEAVSEAEGAWHGYDVGL